MHTIGLFFKKLNEKAVSPSYSHDDDACLDIYATSFDYDLKRNCYVYHTGLAFSIPKGYEMQIRPRSSIRDVDCYIANSPGTIDSGYNGEVLICFKNNYSVIDRLRLQKLIKLVKNLKSLLTNNDNFEFEKITSDIDNISDNEILEYALSNAPFEVGNKIAQFKISERPKVVMVETDTLSDTERGSNGFGSTGE